MAKTRTKKAAMGPDGSMSLGGHMKELRNRLAVCALIFVLGTLFFLAHAADLVTLLADMGRSCGYQFVVIAPQEKLLQYFRLAIMAAVVVTVPVALYEAWAFAKPGLKKSEYVFFGLTLLLGLGLFCVGVFFAYKVTLPFMLNFLITLEGTDYIAAQISIASYLSFVLMIFTIFGFIFEIPLVTIILAKLGIASPDLMTKGRGVAIVLCFFVAAVITPPDIVSQTMVAIPMVLLYQISIWLAKIFYKPRLDEDDEDEEEDDSED